jgi:hypothetical protein
VRKQRQGTVELEVLDERQDFQLSSRQCGTAVVSADADWVRLAYSACAVPLTELSAGRGAHLVPSLRSWLVSSDSKATR